jgi:C4-dicarboxylate transporter DctM subunit
MLLFMALASGLWVAFAMILVGVVGIIFWMPPGAVKILGYIPFSITNNFVLTAIPLFVFMGEVLFRSGISDRLYEDLTPFFSHFPGQLFHTNIASCAVFAAACGSSPATAATIGTVALPQLLSRGYDSKLALGSIAAGGTLGILIPPSIIMIIYGSIVGESVAQLFLAGFVPGIMISLLFMLYIGIRCITKPGLAPSIAKTPWRKSFQGLWGIWPIGFLFVLVLGGIYAGIVTATEAAGVGAAGAMVLAWGYRKMTWKTVQRATLNTVRTTCMVMILIVGSNVMVVALANLKVPEYLVKETIALGLPPLAVLTLIFFFYLILGCLMDGVSMIVLTLPITYPIVCSLGFDSVWFGVIIVILVELALLTPPVGINLYILQGILPDISLGDVIRGAVPFVFILLLSLIILTAFPQIALWLPANMVRIQ